MQLHDIARALDGRVYKDQVGAPAPGRKRNDRSLSVKLLPDGDILVNSHRGEDWRGLKAYVRQRCGMPAWQPKTKPVDKQNVPRSVRLQFLSETLKVCRNRPHITVDQFKLLINDARLAGVDLERYAEEFSFGTHHLERCMSAELAHYDADTRARMLNLKYAERMHLGLRRTGSVDVDKAARERLTADRRNAKKRAKRAAARAVMADRGTHIDPLPGRSSHQRESETEKTRKQKLADQKQVQRTQNSRRFRTNVRKVLANSIGSERPSVTRNGGLILPICVAELPLQMAFLAQNDVAMEDQQHGRHQDEAEYCNGWDLINRVSGAREKTRPNSERERSAEKRDRIILICLRGRCCAKTRSFFGSSKGGHVRIVCSRLCAPRARAHGFSEDAADARSVNLRRFCLDVRGQTTRGTQLAMPQPVIVTIPHRLGKEEARRRLQAGLSSVHAHLSDSLVMLNDAWVGDHMDFQARLLGQSTTGSVDVANDHVRLEVQLPWVLAMVANKAKSLLKRQGQLMLEKPTDKR